MQWAGFEDKTWEPCATMAADAPQVVREFEALRSTVDDAAAAAAQHDALEHAAPAPRADGAEAAPHADGAAAPPAHAAPVVLRESRRARGFGPDGAPSVVAAVTAGVGLLDASTPQTYAQATSCVDAAKWRRAMDKEIDSCMDRGTWDYVSRASLPKGTNMLP